MATQKTLTGYSMYTPQKEFRNTFAHFEAAGLDLFSATSSQNSNGCLTLDNVLPAVSGGFQRRWGTTFSNSQTLFDAPLARLFSNAVSSQAINGVTYPDYFAILATDNRSVKPIYSEGTLDAQAITGFSGTGQVYGCLSRSTFYAFDGVGAPQKKSFLQNSPQEPLGFTPPTLVTSTGQASLTGIAGAGHDYNFSTTTLVITDTDPNPGSGATATVSVSAGNGAGTHSDILLNAVMNLGETGHGYHVGTTKVVAVDTSGGSGGLFNPVIDADGLIRGLVLGGNMIFNSGRLYAIAFKDSLSGQTSDVTYGPQAVTYSHDAVGSYPDSVGTAIPYYNQGCTNIVLDISFSATGVSPRVDTVVLLATSDGGDKEHMYEVEQIPLTSFNLSGDVYNLWYVDTLPDTYNDTYISGNTLLESNLWVDVDGEGDTIGLVDNTIPIKTLNKPIIYQGRMFATDGKTVYFSKNLAEVTTSTGLITSLWEEDWPSANRVEIGFDNEIVTGMLTDNSALYIGTNQNIYRLIGTRASNFSVQCIFRNVGILSQDAWNVVYKEGLPAGYLWVTPDMKIMFSDFNNYQDIGKPVYPLLSEASDIRIQPLIHGPYAMVFMKIDASTYLVLNLMSDGWYRWTLPYACGEVITYTKSNGIDTLFFVQDVITQQMGPVLNGVGVLYTVNTPRVGYIDPASTQDSFTTPSTNIPWKIRTGWQDLGDMSNIKVVNSLDCWTTESKLETAIFARSYATPSDPVPSRRDTQAGPLSMLHGALRAPYAAAPTAGKLLSFEIGCSEPGTDRVVLDQFIVEHFPFGRI